MRVIYHKRPRGRRVKWSLSRTGIQRWHFLRVILTHLFTHERIETTYSKAYHIRRSAEKVVVIAKKFKQTGNEKYFRKLERYLTTREAIEKLVTEVVPRLEDSHHQNIIIKKMDKFRKGDNAQMGYIEIKGNDLALYEEEMELTRLEALETPTIEEYDNKILNQEEAFFLEKISDIESQIEELRADLEEKGLTDGEIPQHPQILELNRQIKFMRKNINSITHDLCHLQKTKLQVPFITRIY